MIRSRPLNPKNQGQAVLEYVMMMAILSTLSLGFAAFFNKTLFGIGIDRLPDKASQCISHPTGRGGAVGCQ